MLLVLDNVERGVAAAPVVADLLRACPGLTVLASGAEGGRAAVAPGPPDGGGGR
jgi:hypothetical protein